MNDLPLHPEIVRRLDTTAPIPVGTARQRAHAQACLAHDHYADARDDLWLALAVLTLATIATLSQDLPELCHSTVLWFAGLFGITAAACGYYGTRWWSARRRYRRLYRVVGDC